MPIADEAAYQKKLEVTREYFRPEMEVLELGCGTGSTAILHAPYVKHIHAVDYSSKMVEIAKRKAAEQNLSNVTFEQGSVEGLQIPDNRYDVVLALSLLHLLDDWEGAVVKISRMLRGGGIFVTNSACLAPKMWCFKYIAPIGKALGLMPMVNVFTKQDLLDGLTSAGFDIDYVWQPEKSLSVFVVAKKPH